MKPCLLKNFISLVLVAFTIARCGARDSQSFSADESSRAREVYAGAQTSTESRPPVVPVDLKNLCGPDPVYSFGQNSGVYPSFGPSCTYQLGATNFEIKRGYCDDATKTVTCDIDCRCDFTPESLDLVCDPTEIKLVSDTSICGAKKHAAFMTAVKSNRAPLRCRSEGELNNILSSMGLTPEQYYAGQFCGGMKDSLKAEWQPRCENYCKRLKEQEGVVRELVDQATHPNNCCKIPPTPSPSMSPMPSTNPMPSASPYVSPVPSTNPMPSASPYVSPVPSTNPLPTETPIV